MSYNSLGVEQFKNKLSAGKYTTPANAKRAVGKAAMSDGDKTKCLKLAAEYFEKGAARPESAARKPAAGAKKQAVVKESKPPSKKKAAKKVVKPAAEKVVKKALRAPRAPRAAAVASASTAGKPAIASLDEQGRCITYLTASIDAMKRAKEVKPDIDLGPGPQDAVEALGLIIKQMHSDIRRFNVVPEEPVDSAVVERLHRSAVAVTAPLSQESVAPNMGAPTPGVS